MEKMDKINIFTWQSEPNSGPALFIKVRNNMHPEKPEETEGICIGSEMAHLKRVIKRI